MVRALDSQLKNRRFNSWPTHFQATVLNKLFTLSPSSTKYNLVLVKGQVVMLYGCEGNCRSGVTIHFILWVLQSLWLPAIWLRHHPLRRVDSVRLQILSVGTCRQCGDNIVLWLYYTFVDFVIVLAILTTLKIVDWHWLTLTCVNT